MARTGLPGCQLTADVPQVVVGDRPHAMEHSLELQLPFLQTLLGTEFSLLPLAVGDPSRQAVDEGLERLWGGDQTLIVVSSDLSHCLPAAQARRHDHRTVQRILGFADDLRGDEACGNAPLNGALRAARRHGLVLRLLDLRNSADTAGGDGRRVVGYGALAVETAATDQRKTQAAAEPDADAAGDEGVDGGAALGRALLSAARAEIAGALELAAPVAPDHPRLHQAGASFVTLHDARAGLPTLRHGGGRALRRALCRPDRPSAAADAGGDGRHQHRPGRPAAGPWPLMAADGR